MPVDISDLPVPGADISDLPVPPVTWKDRVQAHQAGAWNGLSYLVGAIPDAVPNASNALGALTGLAYDAAMHKPDQPAPSRTPGGMYHYDDPVTGAETYSRNPAPAGAKPHMLPSQQELAPNLDANVSPVGGAIARLLDKNHGWTPTTMDRPDDTLSRYIYGASSLIPGAAVGSGGAGSIPAIAKATAKTTALAVAPNAAGQFVAEKKPFESDAANNATSFLTSALAGALMPKGRGAPIPGREEQDAALQAGQQSGHVFPPATTNPTAGNRLIESLAGKQKIQQMFSLKNQQATNANARSELGLGTKANTPISETEIIQAKANAAPAYEAIRGAGHIKTDPKFVSDIDAALSKQSGAGKLSSKLQDNELSTIADDLKSNASFDSGHAIDTIAALRDKASSAYREGNSQAGKAYRSMGQAIEDAMDRHLSSQQGAGPTNLLSDYRSARQQFAKIATIEDARNPATGNIDAVKLFNAYKKDQPLSGALLTTAKAAGQAPLAFKEPTHSAGASHLGLIGSVLGGSALAEHLLPAGHESYSLLVPAVSAALYGGRSGAQAYAKSRFGQRNAIPSQAGELDPLAKWVIANGALQNQTR